MCAGGTIYEAIKKCNLEKGSLLGIVGLGALGSLGIQFAKAMVSAFNTLWSLLSCR
jgi:D-arabinose 1-dehydrogenase-like Zn-dependent alcohol dehydrogenase